MTVELETRGEEVAAGWRDQDGFVTYIRPGHGPRSAPRGEYSTGPDVGTPMPNVCCLDSFDQAFNLDEVIAGQPAIFIFLRSAVW
jgi:hypothetical protein